ncbi:hypothetical protein B2K_10320 [Paenibacillus mucilaginosus K02]|uniref:HTH araC/xylS-type domain-containing protein n=2 Tax=Paenibacillus mucilaginosus TaxID=61624 RepID=I0BFG7_9BACL|nr:hypothetical protein B2K_10320 [Paenibacillus mucilaginosus K02]
MSIVSLTDLAYIGSLLHESFSIPVFFMNRSGRIEFDFTGNLQASPLHGSMERMLSPLLHTSDSPDFPVLRTSDYFENFCSILIEEGGLFQGVLLLGPVVYSQIPDLLIMGLVNDYRMRAKQEEIAEYYRVLPIMPSSQFVQASCHAYYMIYRKQLDPTHILRMNRTMEQLPLQAETSVQNLSERRLYAEFHRDRAFEKQIWECIQKGQADRLRILWQSPAQTEGVGVLSKKSQVRNQKNLAISSITLATRYAMDGGLPPETAYTLSDLYIQMLEELTTAKDVDDLLARALYDFADRVNRNKTQSYTKPVKQCINYMFNHVYEEVPLSTLAELTGLHAKYISTLFKKEVGVTFTDYFQQLRIEEAKSLMRYSERTITDICVLLNFYDQSYFTKVFKKQTGRTPKQYIREST